MARGPDEIRQLVEFAKLKPSALLPHCQEVYFSTDFQENPLKLVEIDGEVEKHLQKGSSMVLRGNSDEAATMCTEDATFELKDVEISNALLIMKELFIPETIRTSPNQKEIVLSNFSPRNNNKKKARITPVAEEPPLEELKVEIRNIVGMCDSYLEMRKVNPPLGRIIKLLLPSSFKGLDREYKEGDDMFDKSNLLKLEDLLSIIPASNKEILNYLKTLKYVEIDGYIRLVDSDYLYRVLDFIWPILDENSWNLQSIVKSTVIAQLCSLHPEFILEKVFEWFFFPTVNRHQLDDDTPGTSAAAAKELDCDTYSVNEDAVCRLYGEVVLKRGNRFNLRDFLQAWQDTVPEGLKTNLRQLDDIAVVNDDTSPPTISYLPEYTLPEVIGDRFTTLFQIKPKWTQNDIYPFMKSLAPPGQNVGVLLTKHCRVSTRGDHKVFSSKHSS